MTLSPIVLFVYNRPDHTSKTLESLMSNDLADQSELFIYCEGPKEGVTEEQLNKIKEVRKVIRDKHWCGKVTIFESDKNNTHPVNLTGRVTEIIHRYGKIIVLEDDLLLGKGFLKYMNEALDLYENNPEVMHISGYLLPEQRTNHGETFFLRFMSCWGWGSWKRAWDSFIPDPNLLLKKIPKSEIYHFNVDGGYNFYDTLQLCATGPWKSWDIRWYASIFIKKGLVLYPHKSLVRNIGHDNSGMHCKDSYFFTNQPITDYVNVEKIDIIENKKAGKVLKQMFLYLYGNSFFSLNNLKSISRKVIPKKIYDFLKKKKNNYFKRHSLS